MCRDGFWLLRPLTFSDVNRNYTLKVTSSNYVNYDLYPDTYTQCVSDCKQSHAMTVADPSVKMCQSCGGYCQQCTFVNGCENCPGYVQNARWSNLNVTYQYYYLAPGYASFWQAFHECQSCMGTSYQGSGYSYTCQTCDTVSCSYYGGSCIMGQSSSYCQVCNEYYSIFSLGLNNGVSEICQGISALYPEYTRCSIVPDSNYNPVQTWWKACTYGWIDESTNTCVTACPIGYYGKTVFLPMVMIDYAVCATCDPSCAECSGPSAKECTACYRGSYLTMNGWGVSTGFCSPKINQVFTKTIYVVPPNKANYNPPYLQDGSLNNAYNFLDDAFFAARSYGAPYTSATITILINNVGPIAMVKKQDAALVFFQMYRDDDSQTTKIIITTDDGKIGQVYTKLRDTFTFLVGGGLTISNLAFDACDSSVKNYGQDYQCSVSEFYLCCVLDSINHDYVLIQNPSYECMVADGPALIKFDISYQTMLTTPPTLVLNNTSWTTWMYNYGAFIEVNDYGGLITIQNSNFSDFSSCGSLIRNVKSYYSLDLPETSAQNIYKMKNNNMNYNTTSYRADVLSNLSPLSGCSFSPEATGIQPCFDLTITGSLFQRIGWQQPKMSYATMVDPDYNMVFAGVIMTLNNFKGNISVRNSQFLSNGISYQDCSVVDDLMNGYVYTSYDQIGNRNYYQIRNIISITNHYYNVEFIGNNFNVNLATRAPIWIDTYPRPGFPNKILFQSNKFYKLQGYWDTSGIAITMRANSQVDIDVDVPSAGNEFCTGLHFESNYFEKCYGCPTHGGAILKLQCNDYTSEFDEQSQMQWNPMSSTLQQAYYNIDQSQHTQRYISVTYSGQTYKVDMNNNVFKNNVYNLSYGTYGYGLIYIYGLTRLSFSGEIYNGVGEVIQDLLINDYQALIQANPLQQWYNIHYGTYDLAPTLSNLMDPTNIVQTSNIVMPSLLVIQRSSQVLMTNMTWNSTWMIETQYDSSRAQLVMLSDIYGEWQLSNITIKNIQGMNNAYFNSEIGTYGLQSGSTYVPYPGIPDVLSMSTMTPLFIYQNTDMIRLINHIQGPNTFTNINYTEDPSCTRSLFVSAGNDPNTQTYYIPSAYYLTSTQMVNVNCFYCSQPVFAINAPLVSINNLNMSNINAYTILGSAYTSITHTFFQFNLNQPYINSSSILVTETVTIGPNVNVQNSDFNTGMLFQILELTTSNPQPATGPQVTVTGLTITNVTKTNDALIQIEAPDIQMTMSSSTFKQIYLKNENGVYNNEKGGVIKIGIISSLILSSITTSDLFVAKTHGVDGGGRFLYYKYSGNVNGNTIALTIQNSVIQCSSTLLSTQVSSINGLMTSNSYQWGPGIYLDSTGSVMTLTVTGSTFSQCYQAENGGAFDIIQDQATTSIVMSGNTFSSNTALNGGAIWCQSCQIALPQNTYTSNRAQYGGDIFLIDPIMTSLEMEGSTISNSYADFEGGSIYATVSGTQLDFTYSNASITTSTLNNVTSGLNGGVIKIQGTSVKTTIQGLKATNIEAIGGSGGFVCYASSGLTSIDLTLASVFVTNSSATSEGGLLWTPSGLTSLSLTIKDSSFKSIQSPTGMTKFLLQYSSVLTIGISNTTFDNSANYGDGLMVGTGGTISMTVSSSVFKGQQAIQEQAGLFGLTSTAKTIVSLTNTTITNTYSAQTAGSFQIAASDLDFSILGGSTITNTSSVLGAGFLKATVSNTNGVFNFVMTDSSISKGSAGVSGGIVSVGGSTSLQVNVQITNSTLSSSSSTIQGGGFDITANALSFITNLATISTSSSGQGGFLYASLTSSSQTPAVTLQNSVISSSTATNEGGFALITGDTAMTTYLTISNTSISSCTTTGAGSTGGFIRIDGQVNNILVSSSNFTSISALGNGGVFDLTGTTTTSVTVNQNSAFSGISAKNGGIFNTFATTQTFTLQDTALNNIQAVTNSAVFNAQPSTLQTLAMTLNNVTASGLQAGGLGSFMYLSSSINPTVTLNLENSKLNCSTSPYNVNYLSTVYSLGNTTQTNAGLFYLDNLPSGSVTSVSNTFQNCYVATAGSAFYLNKVPFTDTNSVFKQQAAQYGAIYSISSQVSLTGTTFVDTLANYGSVLYLQDSNAIFSAVTLSNGKALKQGGAIYAQGSSAQTIQISGCTQPNSYFESVLEGGFLYANNPLLTFTTSGCNWQSFYSGSNGAFAYTPQINSINFTQSSITNTTTSAEGSFLYSQGSTLTLTLIQNVFTGLSSTDTSQVMTNLQSFTSTNQANGSLITVSNAQLINSTSNQFTDCRIARTGGVFQLSNTIFTDTFSSYKRNGAMFGGSISLSNTVATLTNVNFNESYAQVGGAFYLKGGTISLTLNQDSFNISQATSKGGLLAVDDSSNSQTITVNIGQSTTFQNLKSLSLGGAFYLDSPQNQLHLDTLTFSGLIAGDSGGLIYSVQSSQISILSSNVQNLYALNEGSSIVSLDANTQITLTNDLFACFSNPSQTFATLNQEIFLTNTTQAGAFYIANSQSVTSASNSFMNCYIGTKGGQFSLINAAMIDTGSTYTLNGAQQGGAYYCQQCSLNIKNGVFSQHSAYSGGILYVDDQGSIIFDNVQISQSSATTSGGVITFTTLTTAATSTLQFINGATVSNLAATDGGLIWTNHKLLQMTLNANFAGTSFSASNTGGAFYIQDAKALTITSSKFTQFQSGVDGSFLYSISNILGLILSSNTFSSNALASTDFTTNVVQGGSFFIQNCGVLAHSTGNTFQNAYNSTRGGGFSLINSSLTDSGSTYKNNVAVTGGVFYCANCTLTLSNPTIQNNFATYGGIFNVQDDIIFSSTGFTILNSYADQKGGVFYFQGHTTTPVVFTGMNITNANTYFNGGIMYANDPTLNFSITNSTLENFNSYSSTGGGFDFDSILSFNLSNTNVTVFTAVAEGSLMYSVASGSTITFATNHINCSMTPWVYGDLATTLFKPIPTYDVGQIVGAINIQNSLLVNSTGNQYKNCYVAQQGGVFSLTSVANFTEYGSTYQNNSAMRGSAIYAQSSKLYIYNAFFMSHYSLYGGVFYLSQTNTMKISGTYFDNSAALIQGGLMYILETNTAGTAYYKINMDTSTITNTNSTQDGGVFYIDSPNLQNFSIVYSKFENISAGSNGGVYFINNFGGTISIAPDSNNNQNQFLRFNATLQGSLLYSQAPGLILNIQKTVVTCQQNYINYYNLKQNFPYSNQGGVFYIANSPNVISQNNKFQNCTSTTQGGIFTLIDSTFSDLNSVYLYNSANLGGVFSCQSCIATLTGSNITNNLAENGGAFLFDNDVMVVLNQVIMTYNQAVGGGVMQMIKSDLSSTLKGSITINTCKKIYSNSASSIGGFAYIQNPNLDMTMSGSFVTNINASIGGVFYITDIDSLTLLNCDYQNFSSPTAAILYSQSTTMKLYLQNSKFQCQPYNDSDANVNMLNKSQNNYVAPITTNFQIQGSNQVWVNMTYNVFSYCGITAQGGVFQFQDQVNIYDISSIFAYNQAYQGGAISCEGCNLTMQGTSFTGNVAYQGGVLNIESNGIVRLTKVSFVQNQAIMKAGVLLVSTQSYFIMNQCTSTQNWANQSSVIDILGGSMATNTSIINSQFTLNSAVTNTISLMYTTVIIQGSSFTDNFAYSRSKNIFAGFTNLYMNNTLFDTTSKSSGLMSLYNEQSEGAYMYIIFDVNMYITNTIFRNGQSQEGGAIFIQGDSVIYISNSTFQNNQARQSGGAIYASSFTNVSILNQSYFIDNYAAQNGGDDLYIVNTNNPLIFNNSVISNTVGSNSIYASQIAVFIQNSKISGIGNMYSTATGGGLYCLNCRSIYVYNTTFKNIVSALGGGVYITETEANKRTTDTYTKYDFKKTTFTDCSAQEGGAMYLDNAQYVYIDQVNFTFNDAYYVSNSQPTSGSGGAIYYTCNQVDGLHCQLEFNNGSIFKNNSADKQGGAIYWDQLEPLWAKNTTYFGNNASEYGDNIACFAQELVMISSAQYLAQMQKIGAVSGSSTSNLRILQPNSTNTSTNTSSDTTSTSIDGQRSGGDIPTTYLAHFDMYGQIVGTDFSSQVRVSVVQNQSQIKNTPYMPQLTGNTLINTVSGIAVVSGLAFVGAPGENYSLSFSTDGIDMSKLSNKAYVQAQQGQQVNFNMDINLRDCAVGEQFTSSGQCVPCPAGSSFSLTAMSAPGSCEPCPTEKAVCNGGGNIGPKACFWRKDNTTSDFVQCFYCYACLGMIAPDYDPKGSCAEGYQGVLCADCQPGFSSSGDYKCQLCPDPGANIVRIIAIFIGFIGALVYLVRSTLSGAKDIRNVTSIFIKILVNHFQLIVLTASFNFNWPAQVQAFFNSSKPVASTTQQLYSFDCLITYTFNDTALEMGQESDHFRIFFVKLVMYAAMPFMLFCVTLIFWSIYKKVMTKKVKKTPSSELYRLGTQNLEATASSPTRVGEKPQEVSELNVSDRIISTLVILLLFVHPNIVQYMFQDFQCMNVDGDNRLEADLEITCYSKQHSLFTYFIAAPALIVWGLGIPFFGLLLLVKDRKKLDTLRTKEKLGFLFRGYRKSFYFWEIIIMYRKIALIFISVFIANIGVIAQALVVFVLLAVFLVFNLKKKPFVTVTLNDLETVSLVTSILSVYCGIFFITDEPEDWIQENPSYSQGSIYLSDSAKLGLFAIIVLANMVFFVYWAFKMWQEIILKFRKMLPKVYICLCNCGNVKRYEAEVEQDKENEFNDLLREDYMQQLREIKKLYNKREITVNPLKIEKFKKYLNVMIIKDIFNDRLTNVEEDEVMNEKKRNQRVVHDAFSRNHIDVLRSDPNKIYPEEKLTSQRGLTSEGTQRLKDKLKSPDDMIEVDLGLFNPQPTTKRKDSFMIKTKKRINSITDYVANRLMTGNKEEDKAGDETVRNPLTKEQDFDIYDKDALWVSDKEDSEIAYEELVVKQNQYEKIEHEIINLKDRRSQIRRVENKAVAVQHKKFKKQKARDEPVHIPSKAVKKRLAKIAFVDKLEVDDILTDEDHGGTKKNLQEDHGGETPKNIVRDTMQLDFETRNSREAREQRLASQGVRRDTAQRYMDELDVGLEEEFKEGYEFGDDKLTGSAQQQRKSPGKKRRDLDLL